MNNIPSVWLDDKNYENVVAICPFCNYRNIFNRADDLKYLSLITDKQVQCLNSSCRKLFRINGDIINLPFEVLIFDCYKLIKDKRYSYCILNLAQSFEMFFALYLRVEIVYKPFGKDEQQNLIFLRTASDNLTKKTKELSFAGMRALFLNHIVLTRVLMKRNAVSLGESEIILAQLTTNIPSRKTLSQVDNPLFAQMLIKVSETQIGDMRNKVVHKSGYRPSLAEVEAALSETQEIINGLRSTLGRLTDYYQEYRVI